MTDRIVLANGTPIQVAGSSDAPHALIVIQEAFGVNDHIRSVAERYAAEGFYAVAPELFHRVGSPEIDYGDFASAGPAMDSLSAEGLAEDVTAAAGFLHAAGFPTATIGIVGYCMGGTVAFFADTLGLVGAAATYYGGGVTEGRFGLRSLVELAPSLQAPWKGFYGDLDAHITSDQVELLREATSGAPVATEVVRYARADHGFNCEGRPAVYNAEASADATARTLEFFNSTLARR